MLYPFLTYGILIWGNTYETTLKPLFILQKKAYCITFSKLDSCSSPLFKSLGLIKFFGIALFQIAIFMYKFHNNEQVFIIMHIILDLQQNTLTIFLMLEPTMANLISVFKVQLCRMLLMIM